MRDKRSRSIAKPPAIHLLIKHLVRCVGNARFLFVCLFVFLRPARPPVFLYACVFVCLRSALVYLFMDLLARLARRFKDPDGWCVNGGGGGGGGVVFVARFRFDNDLIRGWCTEDEPPNATTPPHPPPLCWRRSVGKYVDVYTARRVRTRPDRSGLEWGASWNSLTMSPPPPSQSTVCKWCRGGGYDVGTTPVGKSGRG